MIKYSVGIDISKIDLHACLSTIDVLQNVKVIRSGSFMNNKTGFAKTYQMGKGQLSSKGNTRKYGNGSYRCLL